LNAYTETRKNKRLLTRAALERYLFPARALAMAYFSHLE
jgi:hypothetical protein